MKTLVVEDDLMSQCLLAKVLTDRGHEVVSYENAEQAILAYQKQFYPLLFVDVGLPGMDGLQFCKWVRTQPQGDKVFIMVAAAAGQPADLNEILKAGANDFLPKPYEVSALTVRLTIAERQMKEFFDRKELEESLRQSQEGFHRVVKTAAEGAWLLNAQFRTEYVNPQMAEMLGYQVEELANRAVIDFLAEAARPDAEKLCARQRDGESVKTEFKFRRKDASTCLAWLSATPVLTAANEFKGSLWMVTDLTKNKDLEGELSETRKQSEAQVQALIAELTDLGQGLQKERDELGRVEQTLQELRAENEKARKEFETQRARLAEDLKTEAVGRERVETQLAKTRDELTARSQELSAELMKAREALQAENQRARESETALKQLRKELEARIQQQTEQLARAEKDLNSEASARRQAEETLQKVRSELELRGKQLTDELTTKDRALQAEFAERRKASEALQKIERDLEARNKQFTDETARSEKALQAEMTERKRATDALQKLQQDLETQTRQHADELAKAERALQTEISERKRSAEALQKAQHDSEARVKELMAELAKAGRESKTESAERRRVEQELMKVREELASRVKEHTAELLKASQELKAEMSERRRVEAELMKTREEQTKRVKDHMAEMVKASEELKTALAERKRVENSLTKARDEIELKVNERTTELGTVREQLKAESAERKQLEQTLARTREELELRLKERTAELAETHEELKKRSGELAETSDKLKAEASTRKRAEETLHKKQEELEAQAKELAAQLDRTKHELSERTAQMARASDELQARADGLANLNEELKNETAAHKQSAACSTGFARLGRELSAARTAQDAARVIAGVTQELIRWDAFSFDLYSDEEGKILPLLNIDMVNGHPADVPPSYPGPEPSPIMRRVMKDGPQLILRSGPSSSHTDYVLFGDRARLSASLMYVAIKAGERVVGFLSVQSYTLNAYDQTALETLQGLADHCGGALERVRAEETRRRSEERFRLIARATNDVVWDWNLETDQVWWNEAFQAVFGYKPEEIEPGSESWKSRVHPEDRDRVTAGIRACIEQGEQAWSDEYRFRRSDGTYAHIMDRGYLIRDDDKKPVRMIGAMTDISQRKQVEAAMIENQARKGAILEMALDCIITIDHEGKIFEWNPAAERTFGYRRADVLGKELAELIVPPAQREKHRQGLAHYIQTGEGSLIGKQVETTAMRSDGAEFPVELEITRISKEGPPIFTAFIRDITERKRAEMEIQKLAAFPRWNPNPVLEFAADGKLTYYNDAAKEMALSLGKEHPSAILPEGAANIVKECLAKGQNKLRLETTIVNRTILWSFFPIVSNQVVHCYAADATERLSLESQLRHAQKMESIGQLAAGVAHDFNNLLSIVQGYSALLMEEKDLKPEMSEALKQIASATERAAHLTRQLLTFSRKQVMNVRTLDLNEVINNVSKLLRRVIGESVALQFNYSPSLPAVEADTGMLEQVVMNLAINARDAMPQGGQLMIGTKAVEIDEAYVQQNPEARAGRFVCLSVADSGSGMDEVTLARIFEPFFTTKPSGKGTGLGLATVYGIVKQHRGWIEVQSRIGQGSTFKIFLPVSGKAVALAVENSTKPAARGGTETILLVEDEPAVLAIAKGILQRLGYNVLAASSGDEALASWGEHAAQIDLLLTDMVMPGSLNGRELAEKTHAEKPTLKVIYTSGYSMELLGTSLTSSKNFVFLQKPYHPDSLASVVRNCLDGKLA